MRRGIVPSRAVLLLLSAGMTWACETGEAPSSSGEGSNRDIVAAVETPVGRWSAGEEWTIAEEPHLTLGVLDGDVNHQFSRVSAAARQSDGDLVVADLGSSTVRLYDVDGAYRKTLGSKGSGPGEFRAPIQVLVAARDSIFVWDAALFRLTKFAATGDFSGVHTLRSVEIAKELQPPLYPGSAQVMAGGDVLVRLVTKSKELPSEERFRPPSGVLRVSLDLKRIATLASFPAAEQVAVEAPWGRWVTSPPLAKRTVIAVQPNADRVCIGDQEGPEIACWAPDGHRSVVRWGSRSIAVDANDDTLVAWRSATAEDLGRKLDPDVIRRALDGVPMPTTWPEYSDILLDFEGNLWVRRDANSPGASGGVEYLVFDSEGELLGSVSLPSIRVLEIGTDYLLGVYQDALEVEYVQIFEIVKPTRLVASG